MQDKSLKKINNYLDFSIKQIKKKLNTEFQKNLSIIINKKKDKLQKNIDK